MCRATVGHRLIKSGSHKLCTVFLGDAMSDNFTGKQVENHTYVKIFVFDFKTSHITDPNLVGSLRFEFLLNLILWKLGSFQSKIVSFGVCTNTAQSALLHDGSYKFCAHLAITLHENGRKLFWAENLMVLVKDLLYNMAIFLTPFSKPSIFTFVPADVIVKGAAVDIQCFTQGVNIILTIQGF